MFGRKKTEDHTATQVTATQLAAEDGASVVVHEERLVARAEKHASGQVRLSKRQVTEERTFTVTLTREELVVEHLDADGNVLSAETERVADDAGRGRSHRRKSTHPAGELVLYGEDVEIVKRRRPLERARLFVDAITDEQTITDEVRRELVDVEETDLRAGRRDGLEEPVHPGKAATDVR